jgi:hypothetical protein
MRLHQSELKSRSQKDNPRFFGGDFEEATCDPIPNSEVKLFGADGTAREAVWDRVGRRREFFRGPRVDVGVDV